MSDWQIVEPTSNWQIVEPETKGWGGVAQDIGSSIGGAYGDLKQLLNDPARMYELAGQFGGQAQGALQQMLGKGAREQTFDQGQPTREEVQPLRAGRNLAAGLGEGIYKLGDIPANISDYLARKEIVPKEFEGKAPRLPEFNFADALGIKGEKKGDKFLQMVGELLPFVAGGEAGLAAKGLGRGMAQRSGALATHAVSQNEDPVKAALAGLIPSVPGLAGAAGEMAGRAIPKARNVLDKLSPSSLVAKYTPDIPSNELMRASRVTEGIQTPLGDVIASPYLKKTFENAVAPMLGSGADDVFTKIAQDINARGTNIIERMTNNPANSDPNTITKDLLVEARQAATAIKNNLWNTTSDTAASEGFNLTLPSFDRFITEHRNAIQNAPLLSENPDAQKMYRAVSRYENNIRNTPASQTFSQILDARGNPVVSENIEASTIHPSIREAKILAGMLDDEAQALSKSSAGKDRAARSLYSNMARALRSDVQQAVLERGSPELQSQFAQANNYHTNTFSNFLDRDIFPLTDENKSGQKIVRDIIKPSAKNDQYEAIQKVNNLLPADQQEVLGFSFLLDAFDKEGNFNPNELTKLIKQLGPRQFQSLFQNPETQQRLLDFMELTRLNKEPINRLFNPHNGKRNQDMLKIIINSISTIMGAGTAGSALGVPGAIAGAVLGPAAIAVGSNIFTKYMASEAFRNQVVGKKIRRRAEQHRRND